MLDGMALLLYLIVKKNREKLVYNGIIRTFGT